MCTTPISQNTEAGGWQGLRPLSTLGGADAESGRFVWLFANAAINVLPNHAFIMLVKTVREVTGLGLREAKAASEIMPLEFRVEPTNVAPLVNARDTMTAILPVAAEIFTALLLIGGLSFTFLEIRRLTVLSERRKLLVIGQERAAVLASRSEKQPVPHSASSDKVALEAADIDHAQGLQQEDYRTFESSWLSRWLKEVDEAA